MLLKLGKSSLEITRLCLVHVDVEERKQGGCLIGSLPEGNVCQGKLMLNIKAPASI